MSRVAPFILLTVLVVPHVARADSILATPALEYTGSSGESLECLVVNLGKDPVEVTIEFVDPLATVVASGTITVLAGGINSILESALGATARYYCRVSGISKGKARVTLCKRTAPSQSCAVAVTVP